MVENLTQELKGSDSAIGWDFPVQNSEGLFFIAFIQSIPEEHSEVSNPEESESSSYLPVQPVINEEELKLHLSADEDDEDEDDDDDDEPFEIIFDKVNEEEELELEEGEAQNATKPEVVQDWSKTPGEENGEQEIDSDVIHPAGVPDQEDPEAVALKKRT